VEGSLGSKPRSQEPLLRDLSADKYPLAEVSGIALILLVLFKAIPMLKPSTFD
jgi:hypothetical protein